MTLNQNLWPGNSQRRSINQFGRSNRTLFNRLNPFKIGSKRTPISLTITIEHPDSFQIPSSRPQSRARPITWKSVTISTLVNLVISSVSKSRGSILPNNKVSSPVCPNTIVRRKSSNKTYSSRGLICNATNQWCTRTWVKTNFSINLDSIKIIGAFILTIKENSYRH